MAKCSQKGRCKKFCEKYRLEGRRMKNKLIRLKKHLLRHPNDKQSKKLIKE